MEQTEARTKESADDYIQSIVARDEERQSEEPAEYRARPSRTPLVVSLVALLIISTGVNIWFAVRPAPSFSPADQEASAIIDMLSAIASLQEYRQENGELPATLELIQADSEGINYEVSNGTFRLQGQVGNRMLSYAEGNDTEWLESRLDSLLR